MNSKREREDCDTDDLVEEADVDALEHKKRKVTEARNDPPLPVVHNVKVQYIRPKYQNLKDWMEDDKNVYIGRQGPIFIDGKRFPPKSSIWANPFKLTKDGNASKVVDRFYEYMKAKLETDPKLVDQLLALSGKNIGCWCVKCPTSSTEPPLACHGQSIVRLFKEFSALKKDSS